MEYQPFNMDGPNLRGGGRDKRKDRGQRIQLGGTTEAPKPCTTNYYLVLCAATDVSHHWKFSNFIGFVFAFMEKGVTGDFITCFPVEEAFVKLKNELGIDTIKFGKFGKDGKEALYTYSRFQYVRRERPFKEIKPAKIAQYLQDWIHDKAKLVKPGDTINIVIDTHGTPEGGIRLGNYVLPALLLNHTLKQFPEGVQVNAVMSCCHSDTFIDLIRTNKTRDRWVTGASCGYSYSQTPSASGRIRNSRFAQAFVQSMARITLPGAPRRSISFSISDFEKTVKETLKRNLTPQGTLQEPVYYHGEPLDANDVIESLIFRDMIDIDYQPNQIARRRRAEYPAADPAVVALIRSDKLNTPQPATSLVQQAVKEEFELCKALDVFPTDHGYAEQHALSPARRNYPQILLGLYWRGRRQSNVWDLFILLVNGGFINAKCLTTPIAFGSSLSRSAHGVLLLLGVFSRVKGRYSEGEIEIEGADSTWANDYVWLAVMIVRGGADLWGLFSRIELAGHLGSVDTKERDFLLEFDAIPEIEWDFHDGSAPVDSTGTPLLPTARHYGFWLPHGCKDLNAVHKSLRRFDLIEEAARECFGCSQDQILLQREQTDYYLKNPERFPGASNDFHDESIALHL